MSKEELIAIADKIIEEIETAPLYEFDPGFHGQFGFVGGYFASYALKKDEKGRICERGFLNNNLSNNRRPILLLYGHDYNQTIGLVTRIEERQTGLYMRAEYFNTPRAQEIRRLVCMGVICQMSYCVFSLYPDKVVNLFDTETATIVQESELAEISLTMDPAQPMAIVTEYA